MRKSFFFKLPTHAVMAPTNGPHTSARSARVVAAFNSGATRRATSTYSAEPPGGGVA